MADSNAPEHTDRGLFGLFGKKDEKADPHVQHQSHTVDPHATHAPSYTAHGEGENKKHEGLTGKLHRSNNSSSSSSSDEEEGGDKKEGRKKKDKVKGKRADHSGDKQEEHEKKGLVEKIKEKLPGHHKEGEKDH